MSLRCQPVGKIQEETMRVARAAFPKPSVYMQMRDELGTVYEAQDFDKLFPQRGQPAEEPVRLALATIMQFAEGSSDRQAAEAVRARIDWKYALGLELTDPGFDHTVLKPIGAGGRDITRGTERAGCSGTRLAAGTSAG